MSCQNYANRLIHDSACTIGVSHKGGRKQPIIQGCPPGPAHASKSRPRRTRGLFEGTIDSLTLFLTHDRWLVSNKRPTAMKVFDEECLLRGLPYEILSGKSQPYRETPKCFLRILEALGENAIFQIENADSSFNQKHALQVHSEDYVEYLGTVFRSWAETDVGLLQ